MTTTAKLLPQLTYFKRFRMERDLQDCLPPVPSLPRDYFWLPWNPDLLDLHAEVKAECFLEEIDAVVFPSLGNREGCRRLMVDITSKAGFQPRATWLIGFRDHYVATVQGVRDRFGCGAIQNLGVIAAHRGRGLGSALLIQALHGFQRGSCHRAILEVTAQNEGAIRLYRRVGFRSRKTVYKTSDALAALEPCSRWLI